MIELILLRPALPSRAALCSRNNLNAAVTDSVALTPGNRTDSSTQAPLPLPSLLPLSDVCEAIPRAESRCAHAACVDITLPCRCSHAEPRCRQASRVDADAHQIAVLEEYAAIRRAEARSGVRAAITLPCREGRGAGGRGVRT